MKISLFGLLEANLTIFGSLLLLNLFPIKASASFLPLDTPIITADMNGNHNFTEIFHKIDELTPKFLSRLQTAIEIPAVSSNYKLRDQVIQKGEFIAEELQKLGFTDIQKKDLGFQTTEDGEKVKLPPVIFSRYGSDPNKKTLLVYCHYDVQPASKSDGWITEPFKFHVDVEKQLVRGRGVSDDTGPLTGWLNVVEAYRALNLELPVNLVTCFEGMEESGSLGLDELIADEANKYFKDVDSVCITDNTWLGTRNPALTYGLRGVHYYSATVRGAAVDLHSGGFGGAVAEPMTDLIAVLNSLVDGKGKILIDGIDAMVPPVTDAERALYEKIDYSPEEMEASIGANISLYDNKVDLLMHRWRFPSLSIHGIEGAFSDPGEKTVIPGKVIGKFSIRTVSNIDDTKLDKLVIEHCNKVFKSLNSPNSFSVEIRNAGPYWRSDPSNEVFASAAKAIKDVFHKEPEYTMEGGSIPITITFQEKLKAPVLLLPIGRIDDGAHSTNEKLDFSNYYGGMKVIAAYMQYYADAA
ncbi:HHL098Wp [Eremothecium sinecaudum]|uniref:HHL098Wp n=1 Tax=Eremothecium sinecaudum TaxID=45286 RepID=A0A0X8HW84_9SACH|nr:HHL098Wp [Eremothecium sinecaudum]AMD22672.1 HHL098Wp [Eremothecium sinecaudum]